MIFKSIRLQNFRQYKNEITIDFAIPENESNNITLIIAANGVGKTTLLQAFRYCFYGSSSNYLNLPKADELINNTLVYSMKDLDEVSMFVEVSFIHDNVEYLARREKKYQKIKGTLKDLEKEKFDLSYLTRTEGWKTYKEADAIDKIKSILPDGLSHVFMFDGERMERNISDPKFSDELKESILGILDIKKYDKLIDILGYEGKASSVIGLLNSKKQTVTPEEQKIKNKYDKMLEDKGIELSKIDEINIKIDQINSKISITEEQQKKLNENIERINARKLYEEKEKELDVKLKETALKFIKESKNALIYKLLLMNKNKYYNFINSSNKNREFYSFLHIKTIEDIIDKSLCICGRPIEEHSEEMIRLEKLKETSLPIYSFQHLNIIDQKFKKASEFNEELERLEKIKDEIRKLKAEKEECIEKSKLLSQEIMEVEKKYGLMDQQTIENLKKEKEQALEERGKHLSRLSILEDGIKNYQRKINNIDEKSEYNKKINSVIDVIKSIKSKLEKVKLEKDNTARIKLSQNFNECLNKTIHGSYQVDIDHKYRIKIQDLSTNNDVTISLSTGQNVVVSLSFIKALIKTAKELSSVITNNENYGVIMDAALSNLDEKHIDKVCKYNLNKMDQLIFLSFKRQLRDEMFNSIKDNVGKTYVLTKNNKGFIEKEEMSINKLEQYIHEIEGDN